MRQCHYQDFFVQIPNLFLPIPNLFLLILRPLLPVLRLLHFRLAIYRREIISHPPNPTTNKLGLTIHLIETKLYHRDAKLTFLYLYYHEPNYATIIETGFPFPMLARSKLDLVFIFFIG
jgi:hypothetical protein